MILLIFVGIFLLNLAPAFTPPTWMALSYIQVMYHPNPVALAAGGAVAATCGRLLLAKLSTVFLRNGLLSERTVRNVDVIRDQMLRHRAATVGFFLFYAFGPLPSNQVFIAYGLTGLRLRLVVLPFLVGRLASYAFWIFTASEISHRMAVNSLRTTQFFGAYFVIVQVASLLVVYLFARIDWKRVISEHRIHWLR